MLGAVLYSGVSGGGLVRESRIKAFVVLVKKEGPRSWIIRYRLADAPPRSTAVWLVFGAEDESEALAKGTESLAGWGVELVDERA